MLPRDTKDKAWAVKNYNAEHTTYRDPRSKPIVDYLDAGSGNSTASTLSVDIFVIAADTCPQPSNNF